MTRGSSALPTPPARSEFACTENALLTMWRTFWLDLPLAWAGEIDRLLYGWVQPVDIGDCLFSLDAEHGDRDGGADASTVD